LVRCKPIGAPAFEVLAQAVTIKSFEAEVIVCPNGDTDIRLENAGGKSAMPAEALARLLSTQGERTQLAALKVQ
jgi:hypothetical protein